MSSQTNLNASAADEFVSSSLELSDQLYPNEDCLFSIDFGVQTLDSRDNQFFIYINEKFN